MQANGRFLVRDDLLAICEPVNLQKQATQELRGSPRFFKPRESSPKDADKRLVSRMRRFLREAPLKNSESGGELRNPPQL